MRNRNLERQLQYERAPELSALERLMNVTTMEEFMTLLRVNGRPVTEHDIYSKYPSLTKYRISAQGGYMAEADVCSPREMTVEFDLPEAIHGEVFFPRCTRVMRCGGCCASRHVACVPVEIEKKVFNVVESSVPFLRSDHLIFSGFRKVVVERHLSCRLQCNLSQKKCGPHKIFLPEQCTCACAKTFRCFGAKSWDPENCRCACMDTQNCFTGQKLNQQTCRCERYLAQEEAANSVFTGVSADKKHPDQPSLTWGRRQPSEPVVFGPARPVSATTSRASVTQAEQAGKCPVLKCPPSFTAVRSRRRQRWGQAVRGR
ncbi:hypothetical protein RRG08_046482 [Elysia crispata]|uniref:Platelet-derived growth factor (PDGF) family profile domain-containing protein n=1 Tax=Elysia crispata TaxID=231223 RepID=A0AAE1CZ98_9GAST|nr:hypothetical protein RRG08_046482 [Elysia crispata]